MPEILPQEQVGVSVVYFGAKGDGRTLNTSAFQSAIDYISAKGGGTVVVPEGVYVLSTVILKSNITLRLMQGAVIKASVNLAAYKTCAYAHSIFGKTVSLIYALGQSDVRIEGAGEIDLNDTAFIDYNTVKPFYMDEKEIPEIVIKETAATEAERPTQPIFFHDCRRVSVNGITIRNSPCWTLSFSCCRNVRVNDINISNNLRTPDSDGIHISACKDVFVSGVSISTGGDGIAVTSTTNTGVICQRINISDCIIRSHSAGIRIGRGASKVDSIIISKINIYDTNRGIGIYANNDGYVENVIISDIILDTKIFIGAWTGFGEPLFINSYGTGVIEGVAFHRLLGKSESGAVICGEKRNIADVSLKDWRLRLYRNHHFEFLGNRIAIQKYFSLPLGKNRLPWVFAEGIQGFNTENINIITSRGEFEKLQTEPLMRAVTQN